MELGSCYYLYLEILSIVEGDVFGLQADKGWDVAIKVEVNLTGLRPTQWIEHLWVCQGGSSEVWPCSLYLVP